MNERDTSSKTAQDYFVRAGSLDGYESLVRHFGGNPKTLMAQAGLAQLSTLDPDSLIRYQQLGELLESTASILKVKDFGLQLGQKQGLITLGLIGSYMAQQPSLETALQIAGRYNRIHAQGVSLVIEDYGEQRLRLSLKLKVNQAGRYFQLAHLSVALMHNLIVQMLPDHSEQLTLELTPAGQESLTFPKTLLSQTPQCPTNLTNEIIARQFPATATEEGSAPETAELVQHGIRMLLPTGECTKNNIAKLLEIHPKKLERQLKNENTAFRILLEQTRKELAILMMQNGGMTLTQLALNLGYSEFSAFSRGFKGWFGRSPSHHYPKKAQPKPVRRSA